MNNVYVIVDSKGNIRRYPNEVSPVEYIDAHLVVVSDKQGGLMVHRETFGLADINSCISAQDAEYLVNHYRDRPRVKVV